MAGWRRVQIRIDIQNAHNLRGMGSNVNPLLEGIEKQSKRQLGPVSACKLRQGCLQTRNRLFLILIPGIKLILRRVK
ncbi:hypothetical protein D3C78_1468390 [compost metagenome]